MSPVAFTGSDSRLRISPNRQAKGFTLVELLTVIAIIGILAGILISVVGKIRSSGRSVQCVSNLRQIHMTIVSHAQENKGVLVAGHNYTTNKDWYQKTSALAAYMPGTGIAAGVTLQQIAVCPENRTDTPMSPQDQYGMYVNNDYGYPYAYNYFVLTNSATAPVVRLSDVQNATQVVMLTDSVAGQGWGAGFADATDSKWSRIGVPHSDKTHVLWCDGHVTLQEKKDIENKVRR